MCSLCGAGLDLYRRAGGEEVLAVELLYVSPRLTAAGGPPRPGQPVEPPTGIYDHWQPALADGEPPAHRPLVAVNMVSGPDGKVTWGRDPTAEPLGSPVDREIMRRLRQHFDAVLRGAGTVRPHPYYPKVPPDAQEDRRRRGKTRHPLAVVITNSCELPLASQFFTYPDAPGPTIVITSRRAPAERVRAAARVAVVRFAGETKVDIRAALRLLRAEFGIDRLLSEGGPRLNWEFLRAGCLDELFWTLAPKLGGYQGDLSLVQGPEVLRPAPQLELLSLYHHEGELFLRYRIRHQAPAHQTGYRDSPRLPES